MPFNSFTTGRDVSLDVITSTGPLRLPTTTTGFEAKPVYNRLKSKPLGAPPLEAAIPDGWEGTISMDRRNSAVDDYFVGVEAGYYAGQNILNSSITETIAEADGSISTYRYLDVSLRYDESGNKTGDNKVEQKIGWFASRRVKA